MSTDFNPDYLPEHERSHLDNPQEAHAKAVWMYPYLRAGSEAVKRGEDFFGGSEQYAHQLAALKHFYHGSNPSPHSTPEEPVADEAPTAPKSFKHGGKVQSIADGFQKKLDGKQRIIASLEKAHGRKPNAKINERLTRERDEAERIQKHIGKIKLHAS